jgi:hypothetical protein
MYARSLKYLLYRNKSFFLFVPRGTGKTAWLKKQLAINISWHFAPPHYSIIPGGYFPGKQATKHAFVKFFVIFFDKYI